MKLKILEYNIVTNLRVIEEIKKYKHFIVSLGFANYIDEGPFKVLSDKDKFAYYYNKLYNTNVQGKGIIGNINFYVDHYIIKNIMIIYYNKEEFVFEFDFSTAREKGIEWYLGSLLKKIEEKLSLDEIEKNRIVIEKKGDPYKVLNNPGQATFEDIKAYQEAKHKGLI